MARRVTQEDVAKAAGVSRFTVSSVINNREGGNIRISDETRQRVLNAVADLGYVPDRMARSLRTRKTYTIACIIPDINNPYYPSLARGIQDVCRLHGYDLLLLNTDGISEQEHKSLLAVKASQVDGIIYSQFHLAQHDLFEVDIPMVVLGADPVYTNTTFDIVSSDNVTAAYQMTSHLIECGHTRIGMIGGTEQTVPRKMRLQGYSQALHDHYINEDPLLIAGGDFTELGGYEAMKGLLKMSPRPTAIFAANDLMALGALQAIREAGLQVPDDIALAGFDDIPAARYVTPALTTINQHQDQIGRMAAECLFERLENSTQSTPQATRVSCELIIRESTCKQFSP